MVNRAACCINVINNYSRFTFYIISAYFESIFQIILPLPVIQQLLRKGFFHPFQQMGFYRYQQRWAEYDDIQNILP